IDAIEGFSSVLAGERTVEEVSFETGEENLFLMPCGVRPPNPVELLSIGLQPALLVEMMEQFDLIVFDAPPLGPVSDACLLGKVVDHVLFVVRSGFTDRVLARGAVQTLRSIGANVFGIILNHADRRAERVRHFESPYHA